MKFRPSNVLVRLLILCILGAVINCGSDGPDYCPSEDEAVRVKFEVVDYKFVDMADDDLDLFDTHLGEETYLRVLSVSEVELILERDGEVVVKRFTVSSRDTVVIRR